VAYWIHMVFGLRVTPIIKIKPKQLCLWVRLLRVQRPRSPCSATEV